MTELDLAWAQLLDDATQKAGAAGRQDILEYLRLKATNDAIRRVGVSWLIDSFIDLASERMSDARNLKIEREDPHTFRSGNSTMVGSLVRVQYGVRKLTLEAGWTRMPDHGIMRKGSLAHAKFTHFGMPNAGLEIRLMRGTEFPQWLDDSDTSIDEQLLRANIELLFS